MTADKMLSALTAAQVKRALDASMEAGSMDAFYAVVGMLQPSRTFFVKYRHRLHSLKAIVTFAARRIDPNFRSNDFNSASGARRLEQLGFDVEHNLNGADEKREKMWVEVLSRPEQIEFRSKLIDLYGQCPLTDCSTLRALEAAHVQPVADGGRDTQSNGILLRADLHKLFDADLLAVSPVDGSIHLAVSCRADYEKALEGRRFEERNGGPTLDDFRNRWTKFLMIQDHS